MVGEHRPDKLKVFISYSRADEEFADELKLGLEDKGYSVELDKHSIRHGEEWRSRLGKLIATSDTVVFVLSPDSARSPICHWEVEEAHRQAKRIVPVLHRGLHEPPKGKQPDGSPWLEGTAKAPERLTLINYPRFDEGRSFMAGLRGLAQALEDDLEWIESHSRLATRARDWEEGGRPTNRLMSGPDIAVAKRLVETRKTTAPPMLAVQLDFIQASAAHEAAEKSERERELEERRRLAEEALAQSRRVVQRTRIGAAVATVLMLLAAASGGYAWQQREKAENERAHAVKAANAALAARAEAERQAEIADSESKRADKFVRLVDENPAGRRDMEKICIEAISITTSLATTTDQSLREASSQRFWELYYSSMYIVELHQRKHTGESLIELSMIAFGNSLKSIVGSGAPLPQRDLCRYAKMVREECVNYLSLNAPEPCP